MINLIVNHFTDIVAFLLTVAVGAHFVWRNNFKNRRAIACSALRAAVLAELGAIYPNAAECPKDIDYFLRSHYTALQTAVEKFRPFVPWWNRWRFERAWFRYRCSTGRKIDIQCYHHYMEFGDNPNYKAIFHDNVSRLLRFANET